MTFWRAVAAPWTSPSTSWALRSADALFGRRVEQAEDREDLALRYANGVALRIALYDRVLEASGPSGDFRYVESGAWTKRELGTVLRKAAEAVR